MKLFLISQRANDAYGTYDSAVVCAPDEETARNMNPSNGEPMTAEKWKDEYSEWCSSVKQVKCEFLGECEPSLKMGLVLASFTAG